MNKELFSYKALFKGAGVVLAFALWYSAMIFDFARPQFVPWLNEILATLISVTFAFLVGLFLFKYQTSSNDAKRLEELRRSVDAELRYIIVDMDSAKTHVTDIAPEQREPFETVETAVVMHHLSPLMLEHAAKSGLFNYALMNRMMRLARRMHSHNLEVSDHRAVLHSFAGTSEDRFQVEQSARSVQMSQEAVLRECKSLRNAITEDWKRDGTFSVAAIYGMPELEVYADQVPD